MKIKVLFPLILAAGIVVVRADDEQFPILKVGSDTYTNVTVTHVTASDISFIHAGGAANVKLKDLPPELQKQFHYDSKQAQAAEQKLVENKAQYHQQLLHEPPPPDMTRDAGTASKPSSVSAKQIWAKSFLNQTAPPLAVEKWLTPQPDIQGKFVILDFWATWCPPCREAIPELNGFQKKFGDKLVVIGISDESEDAVRKMTTPQIEYSIAIDTQARTKRFLAITGIPHVLIIDPKGIVRWEGFPFLKGYELSDAVVADIIAKYSK
jgi:thiol-disulfide isomerase/thioredoxin